MRRFVTYLALACLSVLLVMVWFHSAQAAPTEPTPVAAVTPFSDFLVKLLQIVSVIVLAAAGWAAKKAVAFFEEKTKIDIPAAQERLINGWVEQGVHLAEEAAAAWLREKRIAMPGGSKMETAFDFVWDMVQRKGLVEWTKDQIEAKINAMVNQKRAATPVPPPPVPLQAA